MAQEAAAVAIHLLEDWVEPVILFAPLLAGANRIVIDLQHPRAS